MGPSWQQGPLSTGAIGHFLTPEPLPQRLLFAERPPRRMRVKFNGAWIADSEDVVLLHEPDRYPVASFPRADVDERTLVGLGDSPWRMGGSPVRTASPRRPLGPRCWR
ncbi:DUF427 domain-containing protein [Streptomyces sp. NPDC059881]|uniref:DUF427 domain-containing protein n=1 Tax=Streptomyces sp. NPDC059881 TaxID=3346986 RepID=UPI00365F173B